MNNLDSQLAQMDRALDVAKKYVDYLTGLLKGIDFLAFERAAKIVETARRQGNTIFVAGNGGSAATANHFANDLIWGTRGPQAPLVKAFSLSANISSVTALGNDAGYENVFVEQLKNWLQPQDVVILISASGNSPNVVKAAQFAKEHRAIAVGLTGFDGGLLKQICDTTIHVASPKGDYCPVEDVHMALCHMLTTYLRLRASP